MPLLPFFRSIALILLAAVMGAAVATLIQFDELDRFAVVTLPFAVLGTAVIATSHGMLVQAGWVSGFAYLLVGVFALLLGSAILALPSGSAGEWALGGLYGGLCAGIWALLDATIPRPKGRT